MVTLLSVACESIMSGPVGDEFFSTRKLQKSPCPKHPETSPFWGTWTKAHIADLLAHVGVVPPVHALVIRPPEGLGILGVHQQHQPMPKEPLVDRGSYLVGTVVAQQVIFDGKKKDF